MEDRNKETHDGSPYFNTEIPPHSVMIKLATIIKSCHKPNLKARYLEAKFNHKRTGKFPQISDRPPKILRGNTNQPENPSVHTKKLRIASLPQKSEPAGAVRDGVGGERERNMQMKREKIALERKRPL